MTSHIPTTAASEHRSTTRTSTAPTSLRTTSTASRTRTIRRRVGTGSGSGPGSASSLPCLVPPDLRCQYKGKLCRNERTFKDDGERHSLCEVHRQRANANQRRWQQKHQHRSQRRRGTVAAAMSTARDTAEDNTLLPYTRRRDGTDSIVQPLLTDDVDGGEEDDWISPLFDHLIAKMEADVAASESHRSHACRVREKPA